MSHDVQNMLERAMSARDLIDLIKSNVADLDTRVVIVSDYGDHCHTLQALAVESVDVSDSGKLYESAYSASHVAYCKAREDENVKDEEGKSKDEDDVEEIIVLNLDAF